MAEDLKHWTWMGTKLEVEDDEWKRQFARMKEAGIDAILPEICSHHHAAYGSDHLPVQGKWL